MKREDYINEVTALIKNKTVKKEIRKEIEAHIDDRTKYYLDAGYGEEESTAKALERMGSPTEVAKDFEKLHNNELWITLSVISLFGYIVGMICGFFNPSFAYVNLVDFSEIDITVSIISILIFCAATVSFIFAVKSKEIALLRTYGIVTIISPLLSFYALRPAAYHFISVFTDFPAAIKSGETIFGNEAFYCFTNMFTDISETGISGNPIANFAFWALVILVLVFTALPIVTGSISLAYAKKLKNEEDNGEYERAIQKFASVLVAVCIVTVIGTGAEIVRDGTITVNSYLEYSSHYCEYYKEAKEKFDSVDIPVSKEDALMLATQDESQIMFYSILEIYNCYGKTIYLEDHDEDEIYETKRFFNGDAYNKGIEKEALINLKIGSSIEDLYNISDFSSFVTYDVRELDNETHIEIRICDKNGNEYWLDYTNGKLVSSTALQ